MRSEFEFILVGGAESVWLLCGSLVGRRCGSEVEDGVSCPPPARPPLQVVAVHPGQQG